MLGQKVSTYSNAYNPEYRRLPSLRGFIEVITLDLFALTFHDCVNLLLNSTRLSKGLFQGLELVSVQNLDLSQQP